MIILGQVGEATVEAAGLPAEIETGVVEEEEKFRLYVRLGLLHAKSGDFVTAADYLEKATAWPFTLSRVQNAADIDDFRRSAEYRRFQLAAVERQRERPVEFGCGEEGEENM